MSNIHLPNPQIQIIPVHQITVHPSSSTRVSQVVDYLRNFLDVTGGIYPLPVLLEVDNKFLCIAGSTFIRALSQEMGWKQIPYQLVSNDTHKAEVIAAIYPFLDSRRFQSIEIAHTLEHLLQMGFTFNTLDTILTNLTTTETYLLCLSPDLLNEFRTMLYSENPAPGAKRGAKQHRQFSLTHVQTMYESVGLNTAAQKYILNRIQKEGIPPIRENEKKQDGVSLRKWLDDWKKQAGKT
jgi:hypothetical protein